MRSAADTPVESATHAMEAASQATPQSQAQMAQMWQAARVEAVVLPGRAPKDDCPTEWSFPNQRSPPPDAPLQPMAPLQPKSPRAPDELNSRAVPSPLPAARPQPSHKPSLTHAADDGIVPVDRSPSADRPPTHHKTAWPRIAPLLPNGGQLRSPHAQHMPSRFQFRRLTRRGPRTENGGVLKTIFICKMKSQMRPVLRLLSLCGGLLALLSLSPAYAAEQPERPAERATQRVAQVVDYVAADYAGAVRDGQVIEASEYAEQQELLGAARKLLPELGAAASDPASMPTLATQLSAVEKAVAEKANPQTVQTLCRHVRETLKAHFALRMVPGAAVQADRGAVLYQQHCATCHGASGRADTPAAAALKPPPVSFHDAERMAKVAPALAFHALTFGIPGTGMAAFDSLPAQDRWHLAFYVVALRHGTPSPQTAPVSAPERLTAAAFDRLRQSATLAELSDEEIDADLRRGGLDGSDAAAVDARTQTLALLRTQAPYQIVAGARFALTRELLQKSVRAAQQGQFAEAHRLAIAAYLDGIEPHEAALRIERPALVAPLEAAFAALRQATDPEKQPTAAAAQQASARISDLLNTADGDAQKGPRSATKSLLASLVIALREGLEVALLIAALLAFLRKSGQGQLSGSVHAGWLASVPAGLLTFALIGQLIDGARRELAEGVISLLAAAVLITVTHWVLGAREAKHWLGFLRQRVEAAADKQGRQSLVLFGIAFFAAYREALETVLFYRALLLDAGEGGWKPVLLGIAIASVILVGLVVVVGRIGRKLNPRPVMLASSILLAVLSVSLTGHGIHAMQEGGYLRMAMITMGDGTWSGIPVLGIYPTWQGVLGQLAVVVLLLAPSLLERLRAPHSSSPSPSGGGTQPSRV